MSDNAMPTALRELLSKARADLKARKAAVVELTMVEVRAMYTMSTQLHEARVARDAQRKVSSDLRKQLVAAEKAARDQDLLNNRAVVSLLIDVDRILAGEETSAAATLAAHERLQRYIGRARGADRKRSARRSNPLALTATRLNIDFIEDKS